MNKPLKAGRLEESSQLASVFTSGDCQAVLLPKAFHFSEKTVGLLRRGDELILRPRRPKLGDAIADLPPLTKDEAAQWDEVMAEMQADQDDLHEPNVSKLPRDKASTTAHAASRSTTATKSGSTKANGKRRS
ncbi:antitoxin [Hydrogenophaga sp.]|uniref:antitoxin n=1 Tax=Hydrogenophaga sp. TaxID=1904254 RepID=UPI002732118E|nr:hypothetical protein [Hydrogenophaga sp.]MDP2016150.1 hypothetical protein [Hydrogenophaga sp.]MDP3168151.1 hypothetical protein [Hydrogenophaga sp.]MDP3813056.1 hypothetical protein [Hydrogenophaga sp.]